MRLLIVDDEIEFARYVATVAEGLGFETEIFDHAHAFQEACRTKNPDAVLEMADDHCLDPFYLDFHCLCRNKHW